MLCLALLAYFIVNYLSTDFYQQFLLEFFLLEFFLLEFLVSTFYAITTFDAGLIIRFKKTISILASRPIYLMKCCSKNTSL